ncbi:MAG TPA: tetratricopeptide repeat protein [Anaerolineales bacterium]|nr:tetratricopeptide repeat protein [Anaerolineales bacterium]
MNKVKSVLDYLNERLFSSTYQIRRLIILMIVIIGLLVISFGTYYYYDRYYNPQRSVSQATITQAEQAVRDDPQNIDKRLTLAETYIDYGRYSDGINIAMQIKQTAPNNVNADYLLGIAYANSGRSQDAIQPLQNFIDSRKNESMAGLDNQLQAAYYYQGDSYLKMGQPQNAIPPLETTVKEVGTDADSIYKLGLAYAGVQRYSDAIQQFQIATEFVPNYTEVYQAMANVYAVTNQPDLRNYALGMVAYSNKDYSTALTLLLKAAQAQPGFPPIFSGLGLVYEATKDYQDARTSYQTALKFNPNDFSAASGLQRVNQLLGK